MLNATPSPAALQEAHQLIEQLQQKIQQQEQQYQGQINQYQGEINRYQGQVKFLDVKVAALSLEVARLKRWRFGKSSESMDARQGELFDKATEVLLIEDAKAEDRAQSQQPRQGDKPRQPKRVALPSQLERIEHRYEIEPAVCPQGHALQRIGEEVSEQLDCVPAQFFVHRHIRGKYKCACCQTLSTAALPAQIIDKGIPAPGLLAQVIIAKHDDHLPLYRQQEIYRRSGANLARSSMAGWIGQCAAQLKPLVDALRQHIQAQSVMHGDETPLKLLSPGLGKTRTAYAWVWRTSDLATSEKAVVFDFASSRAGHHAQSMLQDWRGVLICDDYAGYNQWFAKGIEEAGCWAHARRKFFEAHQLNASAIANEALQSIQKLYELEDTAKPYSAEQRLAWRAQHSAPHLSQFKSWLQQQRQKLANADATARAIDYTLRRWQALTLHLSDAGVGIDNNAVENAIRPLALGRKNWLFVGSELAGERAMMLMSLIESAKLNEHDPWAYLKDILEKLPSWPNSRLEELLPHRWQPPQASEKLA